MFLSKKGLSDILYNSLLIVIVFASVVIMGIVVMNLLQTTETSFVVSQCKILNYFSDYDYKKCLVQEKGVNWVIEKGLITLEEAQKFGWTGFDQENKGSDRNISYLECRTQVNPNDLMGHYCFEGNFNDSSGMSNKGKGYNDIRFETLLNGNTAAKFDGINDYVEIPSSNSLRLKALTISFWVDLGSTTDSYYQQIIRKGSFSTDEYPAIRATNQFSGWSFFVASSSGNNYPAEECLPSGNNDITASVVDGNCRKAATAQCYNEFGNIAPSSGWHMVTETRDNYGNLTWYIDGVKIAGDNSKCKQVAANPSIAINPIWIGSNLPSRLYQMFNGSLDELMIYNTSLSSGNISKLYDEQKNMFNQTAVIPVIPISNVFDNATDNILSFDYQSNNPNVEVGSLNITFYFDSGNYFVTNQVFYPSIKFGEKKRLNVYYLFDNISSFIYYPIYTNGSSGRPVRIGSPAFTQRGWDIVNCSEYSQQGLVGCYRFDNGFLDYSENKNDGAAKWEMETKYLPGGNFVALFDGINDYIEIPSSESLKLGNMSISFWIKPGNWNRNTEEIIKKGSDGFNEYNIKITNASENYSSWTIESNTSYIGNLGNNPQSCTKMFSNSVIVEDGNWHQVVMTRNGRGEFAVYIDGIKKDTQYCEIRDYVKGDNPLFIGKGYLNTQKENFAGLFDELLIYNRVLSSNEIASNYLNNDWIFRNPVANDYSNYILDETNEQLNIYSGENPDFENANFSGRVRIYEVNSNGQYVGASVHLQWDPSPDANVASYKIYDRYVYEWNVEGGIVSYLTNDVYSGSGLRAGEIGCCYADVNPIIGPNWYWATALTADGVESLPSNVVGVHAFPKISMNYRTLPIDPENPDLGEKIVGVNFESAVHRDYAGGFKAFKLQESRDLVRWVDVPFGVVRIDDWADPPESFVIHRTYITDYIPNLPSQFFRLRANYGAIIP